VNTSLDIKQGKAVNFCKYIFALFVVVFSSHVHSESVLVSKSWLTECEHDVFDGTSECLVMNHHESLNSKSLLIIERDESNQWALVVLINEKVDNDFRRPIELSVKVDKNAPHVQQGWLSYRNEKYAQAVATFDKAPLIMSQMKNGSFISVKVAIPVIDFEKIDKFSLAGFTKAYNKALALDKRRPESDDRIGEKTKAYYETRAKQSSGQAEASNSEIALSKGLMSAMEIDNTNNERVGDSGVAIQAYIKKGYLGKKPKQRSDYTDYWVIKKPVSFMGHQLVIIEEEYMTKYIGCCVSPGIGITVKVGSDMGALKDFALENKCSITTKSPKELNEEMSFLGTVAKSKGSYMTLSCRERDANR